MSEFLSFGGRKCGHDLVVDCASEEDFERAVKPLAGSCETGAMLGWKVLRARFPKARILTIHRPVIEVYNSLLACGIAADLEDLVLKEQMLLACAQSPGVLSVTFDQLGNFEVCNAIFAHCLEMGLEYDYWKDFDSRNIQVDMPERIAKLRANAVNIAAFRASVTAAQLGGPSWGQH
jgi:hypothetical protein